MLAAIGFLADQALNFQQMLDMTLPQWFWPVVFASFFFISVFAIIYGQHRRIEALERVHARQPSGPSLHQGSQRDFAIKLLLAEIETLEREGNYLANEVHKISSPQIRGEMRIPLQNWADKSHDVLHPTHPSQASRFLTDLPPEE